VPVVEPGALSLAFPQAADAGLGSEFALGDLLSDMLFGEVIDISDLIPQLLSPPDDAAGLPSTDSIAAQTFASADGADILATAGHASATLTILYDADPLAAGGIL
jgi:hypothetical protein